MKKDQTNFFINAFYHSKFKDNMFVIKAGGKIIEDDKARTDLLQDIKELNHHGIKVLLVYGGGNAMDVAASERGIAVKKEKGRRVTDKATIELMKEIIGGKLSLLVQETMSQTKLEGVSLNAVPHDWLRVEMRPKNPMDYGYVGDIHDVFARPIRRLFKVTDFIACPCLAMTDDSEIVNINADTIATELAIGIKADKLVFLSDVDGVKIKDETAFVINDEEIMPYIQDGTITGGMQVKMENCLRALTAGVKRIHLLNGLRENALHHEIFEPIGPGTMVLKQSEQDAYMNEIEIQKAIGAKK